MQPWAYWILLPVALVILAVAWSVFRHGRPLRSLRMTLTKWCSLELEWDDPPPRKPRNREDPAETDPSKLPTPQDRPERQAAVNEG
jgi:hypothetical protein